MSINHHREQNARVQLPARTYVHTTNGEQILLPIKMSYKPLKWELQFKSNSLRCFLRKHQLRYLRNTCTYVWYWRSNLDRVYKSCFKNVTIFLLCVRVCVCVTNKSVLFYQIVEVVFFLNHVSLAFCNNG